MQAHTANTNRDLWPIRLSGINQGDPQILRALQDSDGRILIHRWPPDSLSFFSGRRAPERPGADSITKEAYSHEVISCGFWPGDERFPMPAFYSYTAPAPPGLECVSILPAAASYNSQLGEFILRYDDVRRASSPEQLLLDFYRTTYEAGANLARWDRETLEKR